VDAQPAAHVDLVDLEFAEPMPTCTGGIDLRASQCLKSASARHTDAYLTGAGNASERDSVIFCHPLEAADVTRRRLGGHSSYTSFQASSRSAALGKPWGD
jgi:hypothetical protein